MLRRSLRSRLFPYTTLFRSDLGVVGSAPQHSAYIVEWLVIPPTRVSRFSRATVELLRLVAAEYAIGARGFHRSVLDGWSVSGSSGNSTGRMTPPLEVLEFCTESDTSASADRVAGDDLRFSVWRPLRKPMAAVTGRLANVHHCVAFRAEPVPGGRSRLEGCRLSRFVRTRGRPAKWGAGGVGLRLGALRMNPADGVAHDAADRTYFPDLALWPQEWDGPLVGHLWLLPEGDTRRRASESGLSNAP